MTQEDKQNPDKIKRLLSGGAEIAGAAIGGALGFLAGGPAGMAAAGVGGVAAALALKKLGEEASDRYLAPREKARVGGVLAIAAAGIDERLKGGHKIRTDGFFDPGTSGRSKADEVAESLLSKAQREAEEKKIQFIGRMMCNVAFDESISAEMAQQLSKLAEALTYRQYCLLKLAVNKSAYGLRGSDYRGQKTFEKPVYQLLYECLDLYHRGLVNFGGEVAFGPTDVKPASMTVQGLGADLYNLMGLATISKAELEPIALRLR